MGQLEGDPQNAAPLDTALEAELNRLNTRPLEKNINLELPESPELLLDLDSTEFFRLSDAGDTLRRPGCPNLPTQRPLFVLEYRRYPDYTSALAAALQLHRLGGLSVNVSRSDCLQPGSGAGYLLFFDSPTPDEGLINLRYRSISNDLDQPLVVLVL